MLTPPNTTVDVSPTTLVLTFASPLGPTNTVTLTCGAEGQPAAVIVEAETATVVTSSYAATMQADRSLLLETRA